MKLLPINIKLDNIDRKILEIIQLNAKITNAQLAKEISLSLAPTLDRVKKLENSGFIKSYHASLDKEKIGLVVSMFVMVTWTGHNKININFFTNAVDEFPELIECHHITGAGYFMLKIIYHDIAAYQKLMLEKISGIEVVDGFQSMVILSIFKEINAIPLGDDE